MEATILVKSPSAAINLDQFCSHLTVSMTQKKCTRYTTVTPRDYEVEPVTEQRWLRKLGPESLHVVRGTPAPRCDMEHCCPSRLSVCVYSINDCGHHRAGHDLSAAVIYTADHAPKLVYKTLVIPLHTSVQRRQRSAASE